MCREKEIKEIINLLETLWLKNPRQRFFQLLKNHTELGASDGSFGYVLDPEDHMDKKLLEQLKELDL